MKTRIVFAAFALGTIVSFAAGMLTSGLAACYAYVAMLAWRIVASIGGEHLANARWLIVMLTGLVHGLAFAGIVFLASVAFPRLKEKQLAASNLLIVAVIAYGCLLAFLFPVTP